MIGTPLSDVLGQEITAVGSKGLASCTSELAMSGHAVKNEIGAGPIVDQSADIAGLAVAANKPSTLGR